MACTLTSHMSLEDPLCTFANRGMHFPLSCLLRALRSALILQAPLSKIGLIDCPFFPGFLLRDHISKKGHQRTLELWPSCLLCA